MKSSIIFGLILLTLGIGLIGLSIAPLETRNQIGHREDVGAWQELRVFLEEGEGCRVEITAETRELGEDYKIQIIQVENDYVILETEDIYSGTFVLKFQAPETGHYDIGWNFLSVSQVTAYKIGDLIPKYLVFATGILVLIVGVIILFLGHKRKG